MSRTLRHVRMYLCLYDMGTRVLSNVDHKSVYALEVVVECSDIFFMGELL